MLHQLRGNAPRARPNSFTGLPSKRRREDCRFGRSRRQRKTFRDLGSSSRKYTPWKSFRFENFSLIWLRGLAQGVNDGNPCDRAPEKGADKIHQLPAVNSYNASIDVVPGQQSPLDIEHILQQRRFPGRHEDINTNPRPKDINTLFKARGLYCALQNVS